MSSVVSLMWGNSAGFKHVCVAPRVQFVSSLDFSQIICKNSPLVLVLMQHFYLQVLIAASKQTSLCYLDQSQLSLLGISILHSTLRK